MTDSHTLQQKIKCTSIVFMAVCFFVGCVFAPLSERPWIERESQRYSSSIQEPTARIPIQVTDDVFIDVIPRSFPEWKEMMPCFQPDQIVEGQQIRKSTSQTGFLYVKPYKSGPSAGAIISSQIARNVAKREGHAYDSCKATVAHGSEYPAYSWFHNRQHDKSFLWTVVQNPKERIIDSFLYYELSQKEKKPTEENFQEFISRNQTDRFHDYYLQNLYNHEKFDPDQHSPIGVANQILNEYDFIGVADRMEESVVALMILLNLTVADVLFLDDHESDDCAYLEYREAANTVAHFLNIDMEWHDMIQYDEMLYQAINKSLDLTIDRIGRAKFEAKLVEYRRIRYAAVDWCAPTESHPCDAQNRTKYLPMETDCLAENKDCGIPCLDDFASEMGLWDKLV